LRRSSLSRWAACSASWDLIVKRSGDMAVLGSEEKDLSLYD
jgi:hypothetical protein